MANKITTLTTVAELQDMVSRAKLAGKTVGFVPTMGALHLGHMTLIGHSVHEHDITICSVFVNPTQFNEKTDLVNYPRTLEKDTKLLQKHGANIVFAPSTKEVYPDGESKSVKVNLEGLDKQMEGAFRPGHFDGVVQVVHRLLEIVTPDALYMGQKDFQQFTIISKMLTNLKMNTKLRVVPIVRAADGLALSSRNVRLTAAERALAPVINKVLKAVNRKKYKLSVAELEEYAINRMGKVDGFKPEYFMIADGHTLVPVADVNSTDYLVACTAVWVGEVRLIDNMIYRKPRNLDIFVK